MTPRIKVTPKIQRHDRPDSSSPAPAIGATMGAVAVAAVSRE
jgi:hypothetical protein